MLDIESFVPSERECIETLREIRWPEGVRCVDCESSQVKRRTTEYREHYARYECLDCGRWFNDLSGTIFSYSKIPLRYWFYLMREMDKNRAATQIAAELPYSYPSTLRMVHAIQESQYGTRMTQKLTGEVEGDDIHLKTGRQGEQCDHRAPRSRGLNARGRGRYKTDRPPVVVWVARDSPRMVIRMCRDVGARTLTEMALEHIDVGSRVDTDSWHGYEWLDQVYDHHTVKHSERYVADDGAHCNTAEAEWSVFKPWWRTFRGVAKKNVHLYLAQYEFERNHRELSPWERLHQVIGIFYVCWRAGQQRAFRIRKALAVSLSQLTVAPVLQPS